MTELWQNFFCACHINLEACACYNYYKSIYQFTCRKHLLRVTWSGPWYCRAKPNRCFSLLKIIYRIYIFCYDNMWNISTPTQTIYHEWLHIQLFNFWITIFNRSFKSSWDVRYNFKRFCLRQNNLFSGTRLSQLFTLTMQFASLDC